MQNYSSMKLELLALYWAVAVKCRDMLLGAHFTVHTDNNPLSYIQTTTKLGATEMRWAADLSLFSFNGPGEVTEMLTPLVENRSMS